MNAHLLLHIPFEGPAAINDWLAQRQATVTATRFWEGELLPELKNLDLLIVMGGCMSVNDEAEYPWLKEEKRFIRQAILSEVPVIGFCLGSQLMANALGARVYPNRVKEIGWTSLEAVPASGDVFSFPDRFLCLEWHGETFDIPEGAQRLVKSAACENQAFQYGPRALALQFHPEMTRQSVEIMIEHCGHELVPSPHVQSADQLRASPEQNYFRMHALLGDILSYLTR